MSYFYLGVVPLLYGLFPHAFECSDESNEQIVISKVTITIPNVLWVTRPNYNS